MKKLKKDIRLKMREGFTIHKANLILKEDSNTSAMVRPTNSNATMGNLASDLADSEKDLPTASSKTVSLNAYDGDSQNNELSLHVDKSNPGEEAKQIQQIAKQPLVKQAQAQGQDVNVTVESKQQRLQKLRENSVRFSKKELNEFLKTIG